MACLVGNSGARWQFARYPLVGSLVSELIVHELRMFMRLHTPMNVGYKGLLYEHKRFRLYRSVSHASSVTAKGPNQRHCTPSSCGLCQLYQLFDDRGSTGLVTKYNTCSL